jgi:GYF domain 2
LPARLKLERGAIAFPRARPHEIDPMAQEWYIQHGGKQYGPLTSADLKKLAAQRKITPATNVRQGTAGNWVAASRVQGLFAAPPASAPAPPAAKAPQLAPQPSPLDVPPAPPPMAPPMASPLARTPLGSVAPVSKATEGDGSIAARIVGAVGLIFGILALSTFWLPMLGGLMGWTGIVVGGLGLILGAVGLVLSAMQKGSGLYLNVAGTSSAAVGLVLTVVLGVTFGMFGHPPAPRPVVAQKPALPPAEPPPVVEVAPPAEPEPPPEIVWTDAGSPIVQGPIKASIGAVGIQNVKLEGTDLSTLRASKPQPMLKIVVTIENTTTDKIVQVPGWPGGGGGLLGGSVDAILKQTGVLEGSEAGKTIESATAGATLVDNVGNNYAQVPALRLFGAQTLLGEDSSLRPAKACQKDLVFPPPLDTIEYLRLELSPAGFGGSEPLRFQIPKAMVNGL